MTLLPIDVEFCTQRDLGPGWSVEVRLSGVLVGHVRRDPRSGAFRYFRVPRQAPAPFYEDVDLAALIRRVARRP